MDFTQVEREVAQLRQGLAAGRLTERQFKDRLRQMMVEDEEGNWWMVGYETGEWYRHDGADWVWADPPGRVAFGATPQPVVQPVAPVKPKPRWFWGIVVLLLGLALTFGAGVGVNILTREIVFYVFDYYFWWNAFVMPLVCASVTWLVGLILTIVITRKVWRGK